MLSRVAGAGNAGAPPTFVDQGHEQIETRLAIWCETPVAHLLPGARPAWSLRICRFIHGSDHRGFQPEKSATAGDRQGRQRDTSDDADWPDHGISGPRSG